MALSNSPLAAVVRRCRRTVLNFTLPAPGILVGPMLAIFLLLRGIYYYLIRIIVCEPLFKAYCQQYGRGVRTGVFIHWVSGSGKLVLGDEVLVDGKCTFIFAARYSEHPTLTIGSNTIISHACSFTVGQEIAIGSHCLIAMGVRLFDAPGHPLDPALRKAGNPAKPEDVRPIRIHDNVWVGTDAVIFPGVVIGEGSVVVTGAYVVSDVPPYTMVAGNPARVVKRLPGYVAPTEQNNYEQTPVTPMVTEISRDVLEDVVAILRSTLVVADLSPSEDFYDAGMTSIMTLPLLIQIEQRFGITLPEHEFFDARTALDLAESVNRARSIGQATNIAVN